MAITDKWIVLATGQAMRIEDVWANSEVLPTHARSYGREVTALKDARDILQQNIQRSQKMIAEYTERLEGLGEE